MIADAIHSLEIEVTTLNGSKPGTAMWAHQQALSLGLSFLRKAEQMKLKTPEELDKFRKRCREGVIGLEEDPAPEVTG